MAKNRRAALKPTPTLPDMFFRFKGLKTLCVLDAMKAHPSLCVMLMCRKPASLTASVVKNLFHPQLSTQGSSQRTENICYIIMTAVRSTLPVKALAWGGGWKLCMQTKVVSKQNIAVNLTGFSIVKCICMVAKFQVFAVFRASLFDNHFCSLMHKEAV